jgi:hypothetical protein
MFTISGSISCTTHKKRKKKEKQTDTKALKVIKETVVARKEENKSYQENSCSMIFHI